MKGFHNYYVYIVECSDGSYYTGVTNDLELRLVQHNNGDILKNYTYSRRPVVLKYYEHYKCIRNAIEREKQLKGWSRKKKEALFREDWDVLKVLSKSRQGGKDDRVYSD
jgi:putative endonuclease